MFSLDKEESSFYEMVMSNALLIKKEERYLSCFNVDEHAEKPS